MNRGDSDTAKRPPHPPATCARVHYTRYITGGGRGAGHSDLFKCPTCGRSGRYALNYLSGRRVVCDGGKFSKVRAYIDG